MTAASSRNHLRILVYVITAAAVLYLGDALSLHLRRQPQGSVLVRRYYALHKSKQKTNFMFAEPEPQTCLHSLFPHSGYSPCWYLERHAEQRIDYE
jgi:hypothetical protein